MVKKSYSKKNSDQPSKATQMITLFGEIIQVTVYPFSKFSNTCAITGATINYGEPIACYENDNGKKIYMCYPLPDWTKAVKVDPFKNFKPDKYQQQIVNYIGTDNDEHLIIEARAGSGKSTLICYAVNTHIKKLGKTCLLAFGNQDAKRFSQLLTCDAEARTTNSFGYRTIMNAFGKVAKFNKRKMFQLLDDVVGQTPEDQRMRIHVEDVVNLCKADAVFPDDLEAIDNVIDYYGIEIPSDKTEEIIEMANKVLVLSKDIKKYGFDFNDQLWLPIIFNLPFEHYHTVAIDEGQDLSMCQHLFIQKLIDAGTRIIAVGDSFQSLYLFRGAKSDGFEQIKSMLANTDRGVKSFIMPICYRCDKAIIKFAQQYVSDIEAAPNAGEGIVSLRKKTYDEALAEIQAGDCMLCRINAPLVSTAYDFIEHGKKFIMRGGDEECWRLIGTINRIQEEFSKTDDCGEFMDLIDQWLDARLQKATGFRKEMYSERAEVLKLICTRCLSVEQMRTEIKKIFMPPKDPQNCIILSTIHRMKGGQAERVYHLCPELVPHPRAKTVEQIQQEKNAAMVAITRAIHEYYELAPLDKRKK